MTHLHLSSRFSAFAASLASTGPPKQSGSDCSWPHATSLKTRPAIRSFLTEGGGNADSVNMGKSNKFDYSKRANSSVRLGEIISRDLEREVKRIQKEAEKAAGKARKQSTSSTGSGSALGSGAREGIPHTLDIQVPSKDLGDEGTCAMAEGLETALGQGSLLLEDINLSGNKITTISLGHLAPVIRLARHDLRTLNLACNSIRVETEKEAVQWEEFLRSFKDCFKLRRLDLSGNSALGAKAFEIMAKVHINEPPITPMPHRGNTSVISLHSELEPITSSKASSSIDLMSKGMIIKRRAGLRSIPFVTLTDTGLDDLSALWLSYILEDHYYPTQLIDSLNATHATSNVATYRQSSNSRGVDWSLRSREGLSLLQKAETFREQMMLAENEISNEAEYHDAETVNGMVWPDPWRNLQMLPGDRRASIRSIRTADGGEHELSGLESARKRLQRSLLERYGASKVELWSTALRLVVSSRILQGIGPDIRDEVKFYTGPSMFDFTAYSPAVSISRNSSTSRPTTPNISSDKEPSTPTTPSRLSTYAATLTANGDGDVSATEATNSARTSKVLLKPQRKAVLSDGGGITRKFNAHVVRDRSPQRFVRWQEERNKKYEGELKHFRNREIPSHLPDNLTNVIAGFTVTRREEKLLTDRQLQAALSWGRRRSNLEWEKAWWTMADSSQTWTLLENIGCLAYYKE